MNGKRYLLDTNAIIFLLQGNSRLLELLKDTQWIGISIISQIEFMAFPRLTTEDKRLFNQFLQHIDVIELSSRQNELIRLIIEMRQRYHIKLPDAIIAATAIQNEASLVTADKKLQNIRELDTINFA